ARATLGYLPSASDSPGPSHLERCGGLFRFRFFFADRRCSCDYFGVGISHPSRPHPGVTPLSTLGYPPERKAAKALPPNMHTTPLSKCMEPIPGYKLVAPLGQGGFGEVWKAEAPGGLPKAIKFIRGSLNDVEGKMPATQELKALNRVKEVHHPFILGIERVDIVDGQLMIVMELADRNLQDRLEEFVSRGWT